MTDLCIVTLAKSNLGELKFTFDSIVTHKPLDFSLSWLIVDGSDDEDIHNWFYAQNFDFLNAKYVSAHKLGVFGIYPSMNLALEEFSSDWVLFMNSGDRLISSSIFTHLQSHSNSLDYFFCSTRIVGKYFSWLYPNPYVNNLSLWLLFNQPCHQSLVVRSSLAKSVQFNELCPISADRLWKKTITSSHHPSSLPLPFAEFHLGGVSSSYTFSSLKCSFNEPNRDLFDRFKLLLKFVLYKNLFLRDFLMFLKSLIEIFIYVR